MRLASSFLIIAMLSIQGVFGRENAHIEFRVKVAGELPAVDSATKNPGIAGVFSGVVANHLVIAGGAKFQDRQHLEGGTKVFSDRMYIFRFAGDSLILADDTRRLDLPVAYGSSVSLPEGILCIGGSSAGKCSHKVFLITWDGEANKISFENFPSLPVPLSFTSAVRIDKHIYVVGGSSSPDGIDTGNFFFRLDLEKRNTEGFGWEELPAFPGPGRIFAPAVAQSNGLRTCLFLFGGRNINKTKKLTVFDDGMVFDPVLSRWASLLTTDSIQFPVMTGTVFPLGASTIAFIGGGSANPLAEGQDLKSEFNSTIGHQETSGIFLYNTITGARSTAGKYESSFPLISSLVPWDGGVLLTCGEIRPGIQSPQILLVKAEDQSFSFGWLNSMVLVLYFFVLVLIGLFFSRKQKSTDDYFKGGGRVPWWAAGISLFGTALSAITFMAIPAKTYSTDWSYFLFNISIFLVAPIVVVLFIPFYRRLNITTAYEYLEKRFNLAVRLLGSISFILFQIGRMGIVLLLPSLALNVVTGMNVFLCILLMGIISLLYTLMGGIEAVIWTDVIQVVILMVGALVAVALMVGAIDGGISTVFHEAVASRKFNIMDFRMTLREPTVWVMLIGGVFTNITTYGTDQTMVQRYMTTKNEKEARQSAWTNAWLSIPATLLFFSIGTCLFVFYRNYPDQYNPSMDNIDSIFPWFIASQLPDGLSGLLIAGIFAAAMSSLSSSMNSGATAYSTDIHFRFRLTSKIFELKIARIATFAMGIAGTLFALLMATWNIQSLWDEFQKLIGLIIGSLGGLFLLGILTRRANGAGALIGIAVSIFVQVLVNNSHSFHLLMYTATGVISCFVFGWLGSLFFPGKNKPLEGLTIYKTPKSLSGS